MPVFLPHTNCPTPHHTTPHPTCTCTPPPPPMPLPTYLPGHQTYLSESPYTTSSARLISRCPQCTTGRIVHTFTFSNCVNSGFFSIASDLASLWPSLVFKLIFCSVSGHAPPAFKSSQPTTHNPHTHHIYTNGLRMLSVPTPPVLTRFTKTNRIGYAATSLAGLVRLAQTQS